MHTDVRSIIIAGGIFLFMILWGGKAMTDTNDRTVFDFSDPEQVQQWMVINDGVMGGVSRGMFRKGEGDGVVFSGTVSLENSGGFSSVSSRPGKSVDLSGFTGIAIRCRGDGKTYKATLKNDTRFTGFTYQFSFTPPKGEWMVVNAPFDQFQAFFRGQKVSDAPPVDRSDIQAFGFIIADKQAGPFSFEIEWIKGYK